MGSRTILIAAAAALGATGTSQKAPAPCTQPLPEAITHIKIAGRPADLAATRDGCWIFVSSNGQPAERGVTVLHNANGRFETQRFVKVAGGPFGLVLTHDEKLLIVAAGAEAVFLDIGRLQSGKGNPVTGTNSDAAFLGSILVSVTPDDKLAFVSQERSASVSVIDLSRARGAAGFSSRAIVGKIPVGEAPVSVEVSPDGKLLYITSQNPPPSFGWRKTCINPANPGNGMTHPFGVVLVADVARAAIKPAESVIGAVRAGCNPVRVAVSPDGATAYVSARTDNALLVFDTKKMLSDTAHAMIGNVPVGTAPVGIAVVENGAKIVVTNSNRFEGSANNDQDLTVVDATKVAEGAHAVIGSIPAGAFPRQIHLAADGTTLLLTNFTSGTLEIIDLKRLASFLKSGH